MDTPIFDEKGQPLGAAAAPSHDADPHLPMPGTDEPPEFAAMSLDQARAMMVREHGVAVGKDDPILLAVTLHQGFCADLNKLLGQYADRISGLLAATGNGYAEAVERMLESFKDQTVQASIQHALALMADQTKATETLRRRLRRYGIYFTFLSVVTVTAALLALAVLLHAIR